MERWATGCRQAGQSVRDGSFLASCQLASSQQPDERLTGASNNVQQSFVNGLSDVPLLYETIGQSFDRAAVKYAHCDALIVPQQHVRWTTRN